MAFGQSVKAAATSTVTSLASSGITTANGQLIAIGIAINAPATLNTVTDSKSNTWIAGPTCSQNNTNIYGYYAQNIIGGSGHTITVSLTGAANYVGFIACTFTGRAPNSALDKSATYISSSYLTAFSGASATPTYALEDLFAFNCSAGANAANTFTAGSGWTIPANGTNLGNGSSYRPMMAEYQAGVSIASYSGSFTQGNFTNCGSIIMTFVAASAGGVPQLMMLGVG